MQIIYACKPRSSTTLSWIILDRYSPCTKQIVDTRDHLFYDIINLPHERPFSRVTVSFLPHERRDGVPREL